MQLLKNDGTADQVKVKPSENIMKFSLDTHMEVPRDTDPATGEIIPETTFRQAEYKVEGNKCSCDNFVLEAHYKVYFKQNAANSFIIEDFEIDLVYGSLSIDCEVAGVTNDYVHTFNIKTSVTYLESKSSRKLSGSPGYLRGKPVIIGQV